MEKLKVGSKILLAPRCQSSPLALLCSVSLDTLSDSSPSCDVFPSFVPFCSSQWRDEMRQSCRSQLIMEQKQLSFYHPVPVARCPLSVPVVTPCLLPLRCPLPPLRCPLPVARCPPTVPLLPVARCPLPLPVARCPFTVDR